MIDAGGIRKGITIELDGQLFRVIDFQHLKLGRGSAQVRLKLRDIQGGHVVERTFQASHKFITAHVERRSAQYLFNEGNLYYFMDLESFDQTPIDKELLADALNYLKDDMTVDLISHNDKLLGVELPTAVGLEVTETGPDFKGDTASAGGKPATLETGITVQVPLFVKNGDVIKVDTRTGEYLERVG